MNNERISDSAEPLFFGDRTPFLSCSSAAGHPLNSRFLLRSIIKNPLIVSSCAAVPFPLLQVALPAVLLKSVSYFADMTLPLALLCTGASLDLKQLRQDSAHANDATCGRLIIAPALITLAGFLCGFRDLELGIIFLMSAVPTAAARYVMARSMGGNANLAANIIAMATLGSLFTSSLGFTVLKHTGLLL